MPSLSLGHLARGAAAAQLCGRRTQQRADNAAQELRRRIAQRADNAAQELPRRIVQHAYNAAWSCTAARRSRDYGPLLVPAWHDTRRGGPQAPRRAGGEQGAPRCAAILAVHPAERWASSSTPGWRRTLLVVPRSSLRRDSRCAATLVEPAKQQDDELETLLNALRALDALNALKARWPGGPLRRLPRPYLALFKKDVEIGDPTAKASWASEAAAGSLRSGGDS